ncbi:hypothetical protein [Burkholderia multivorans]|uniref:hypothetical protein n=1 Tax=Burkholderia multivorans TaxID=87883 RepID=UPI001E2EBB15|nr:hypothetical protein [Burkholderia multivorans]
MRGGRLHDVVVAIQRAARQVRDAVRIVVAGVARQLHAERRVDPGGEPAPADAGEPRQPGEQQHDHRDRRADRAEHVREAARERMAERVRVGTGQRARQRATRDEYGRKAEPQANRAGAGEAAAARQHRLHETPEEEEEPDGGDAEPAENNRVHALKRSKAGSAMRDPPSLTGRRPGQGPTGHPDSAARIRRATGHADDARGERRPIGHLRARRH